MSNNNLIKKHLIIGTRDSELALKQTNLVIENLKAIDQSLQFEIKKIKTSGDLIYDKPLYDLGGKALFTKEIDLALLNEEIDLAVHSAKDIDSNPHKEICFPFMLPREDPADSLISFKYKNLLEIPNGGTIGTCSLRRKEQILLLRPDLNFEIMRGNINSRINKLKNSENLDAIILAAAGLKRINLEHHIIQKFETDQIIPSPCQGIIAVSCLDSNENLKNFLKSKSDLRASLNFQIERKFLETLNASCKSAVGCFSLFLNNDTVKISCIVLNQEKKIYKKIAFISNLENSLKEIEIVTKNLSRYLDK